MKNDHHMCGATKIDTNHLLSADQISIVRDCTRPGDEIRFRRDEDTIEGVVDKKYSNLFTLKDGRSFTWVDYITGSPEILDYLRMFHPISFIWYDPSNNMYRTKHNEKTIMRSGI